MSDALDRLADRLDRVVDRLDRVVDRLDTVLDRQVAHTATLREIKKMTAANAEGQQALLDSLAQLDAALTQGLNGVVNTVNNLNAQIERLEGVDEDTRQALARAAADVTGQVTRVTQAFSTYRTDDATPPEPEPVPDPEPAPERPEPGPVGPPSDGENNGDLSFGP